MEKEVIGKCPKCGENVYEEYSYYCSAYRQGCKFNLKKENMYFNQNLFIEKSQAKKLLNGETIKLQVKNKEGKPYLADFGLDIRDNEVLLKKIPYNNTISLPANTKFYVHKKYAIKLDGLTTDIHIGKGAKKFITDKLENVVIQSFKASSPYINIKSIINNFNLDENVKKIFVISSDEVNNSIDEAIRRKNNREFLEGMTYYTEITYGNGIKKREQHFENNLDIHPFKYSSFADDKDINKPNYFNLHSKFYLINDEYAFIGSANLTEKGLSSNFETLFFIDKKVSFQNASLINELVNFFEKISNEKNIKKEDEIFSILESDKKKIPEDDNSNVENQQTIKLERVLLSKIKSFFKF